MTADLVHTEPELNGTVNQEYCECKNFFHLFDPNITRTNFTSSNFIKGVLGYKTANKCLSMHFILIQQ